jgi:hypothetical protein
VACVAGVATLGVCGLSYFMGISASALVFEVGPATFYSYY